MVYFACKGNISREIKQSEITNYVNEGWIVSNSPVPSLEYDPYNYATANEQGNCLQPIIVNGESFLGYSSFYCINTKTYKEEPQRTTDGSIPNINDYETFIVPRVTFSFDYMTIYDFRRLLKAITPNEFVVSYYDYEIDSVVSYKMYCEPREMAKIYNRGFTVLATTGVEFNLNATLNDMDYATVKYIDASDASKDPITLNEKKMIRGMYYTIENGGQYTKQGYNFSGWNTQKDGTGTTYNSYDTIKAKDSMTLYAQWVVA